MKRLYVLLISIFLFFFGFIGFFASAICGNPVAKTIARGHINNFINEAASGKDLKLISLHYNLENSGYDASILDEETGVQYHATVDELGIFYQDVLPDYAYPKRIVRFPSAVCFISIGSVGLLMGLFCLIHQSLLMKKLKS